MLAMGATWIVVGVTALMAVVFMVLAVLCFRHRLTGYSLIYLLMSLTAGVLFSITINS